MGSADSAQGRQIRRQGFAFVKHKAAALVMGTIGFLEVLEDAAFELVHMGQAFFAHEDGGLLAADAAGAEAHHRLVLQFGLVGLAATLFTFFYVFETRGLSLEDIETKLKSEVDKT